MAPSSPWLLPQTQLAGNQSRTVERDGPPRYRPEWRREETLRPTTSPPPRRSPQHTDLLSLNPSALTTAWWRCCREILEGRKELPSVCPNRQLLLWVCCRRCAFLGLTLQGCPPLTYGSATVHALLTKESQPPKFSPVPPSHTAHRNEAQGQAAQFDGKWTSPKTHAWCPRGVGDPAGTSLLDGLEPIAYRTFPKAPHTRPGPTNVSALSSLLVMAPFSQGLSPQTSGPPHSSSPLIPCPASSQVPSVLPQAVCPSPSFLPWIICLIFKLLNTYRTLVMCGPV